MTRTLSLPILLASLLWSPGSVAQEATGPAPETGRIGLHASYGFAAEINGSVPVDLATLAIRRTWPIAGFRPFGGASSWGLEGTLFAFDQDPLTQGLGFHAVYELRAPEARVTPVLRLGVGALATTHRVPAGETHHNFSLGVGLGIEAQLGGGWLEAGYRLHHVSNADTGLRNLGINAHSVVLGFSWGV